MFHGCIITYNKQVRSLLPADDKTYLAYTWSSNNEADEGIIVEVHDAQITLILKDNVAKGK